MASPHLLAKTIVPVACGVTSHIVSHRCPPTSIPDFLLVLFLPPLVLTYTCARSLATTFFLRSLVLYLSSLATSIVAYRISPAHPLARYPGPFFAKISRLWATRLVVNGKQFLEYHHLFERYGDVVRTGPNHLMVRNASAVSTVLGARNQWLKNGRYTVARPDHSYELITIVDPAEHSRRRRIWEPAFTPTAIKSYAAPLRTRVEQLSAQLSARLGTPLDIAEWLGFLTIDFMGDFAFGSLFNLITDGADHRGIHKHGVDGLRGVEVLGTIPWIRPLVLARPNPSIKKRFAVALGVVEKRQQERSERRDLSYYLMNEGGKGPHPGMTTETLAREGMLALFAGADTTSTTMAGVLFYLMTHPACFRRLRAELDGAAGAGAPYDVPIEGDALVGLKYLDAVINETLRLQPAVPSGVQRVPPRDSGPVLVVGHLVPPGTTVQIPSYSLHRDSRCFSPDPTAFWPERWLPQEGPKLAAARGLDFQLNTGAFIPFSHGPANCVGRALAMVEMRFVLAALIRRFDFALAPGFEPGDWTDNLGDAFAMTHGKLLAVVRARSS